MACRSWVFSDFSDEQQTLNRRFWSSELAVQLAIQGPVRRHRSDPRQVHEIFSSLRCHAFIPPRNPKFDVKYEALVRDFEQDLYSNLEFLSKTVIFTIHRAAELYLKESLEAAAGRPVRRIKPQFVSACKAYQSADRELKQPAVISALLEAQIYAEIRNDIAHADGQGRTKQSASAWSDLAIYERCENERAGRIPAKERRIFPDWVEHENPGAAERAVKSVIEGARAAAERHRPEPLIFFYALFGLGAFMRFCIALEDSLPLVSIVRRDK
jgi:hypothetical protein